ncbi:hypothetical protein LK398_10495 [Proteus mirabilis]|nr:hypothetical protein [Proteus mirabilis]UEQ29376.1 hypothetical protein LK398_10495 [Proteus mirabilis]
MSYTKRLSLICAICLGTFMATLDISIVNVALPTIQNDINANMGLHYSGLWMLMHYVYQLVFCLQGH